MVRLYKSPTDRSDVRILPQRCCFSLSLECEKDHDAHLVALEEIFGSNKITIEEPNIHAYVLYLIYSSCTFMVLGSIGCLLLCDVDEEDPNLSLPPDCEMLEL